MVTVRKLTLVIGLMVLTKLVAGHMHMKSGIEMRRSQTYLPLYKQLMRRSIPTNRAAMPNFGTTESKFNMHKTLINELIK